MSTLELLHATQTTEIEADVTAASRPIGPLRQAQRLGDELQRLQRMHLHARTRPQQWRAAIAGHQTAISLWLYGVALAVLAQGLPDAALALLDILPGIDGGSGGKRALLLELLAASGHTSVAPQLAA